MHKHRNTGRRRFALYLLIGWVLAACSSAVSITPPDVTSTTQATVASTTQITPAVPAATTAPTTALPTLAIASVTLAAIETTAAIPTDAPTTASAQTTAATASTATDAQTTTTDAPSTATVAASETTAAPPSIGQGLPDIALATTGGVELLRADGTRQQIFKFDQTMLNGSYGAFAEPAWSPDGYRLATTGGVWTFGADPAAPPRRSPLYGDTFRWSPSGQRLAFLIGITDADALGVVVTGPDGSDPELIDERGGAATYSRVEWLADGTLEGKRVAGALPAIQRDPNSPVAPDGKRFARAITAQRDDLQQPVQVQIGYTEGERDVTLATLPLAETAGEDSLSLEMNLGAGPPRVRWLPNDGGLLVPISFGPDANIGTWLVKPDGTYKHFSPYVITDLHPDGQRMLATTDNEGNGEIVVVRIPDGSVERKLGPGLGAAFRPARQGSPPPAPLADRSPTLALQTPRASGLAVRELQTILKELGFGIDTVDGVFGPQTGAAVQAFQERHQDDLGTPDGVVGGQTWMALRYDALLKASGHDPYADPESGH